MSRYRYEYAQEKFAAACHCLAVGKGDVRSRLFPAFMCLTVITIHPEKHLPPELLEDFQWVYGQLTKYKESPHPLGPEWQEGNVKYTLSRYYNKTAARIARRIWDIWVSLRYYE
jgi:hypothetical protein